MLLQLIGRHFLDGTVAKIKEGGTFRGTGDNWDMRILKSHMRKDNNNEDLHLFASNLIENRINFSHLDNVEPICDIAHLNRAKFSLDREEWKKYICTSKIIVGRIITDHLTKFEFLKKCLPEHITHQYSKEMAKKSSIISMPIIDANEAQYADCVKILRQYESWISQIYHEAGLLQNMPVPDNPLIPDGPAAPGQTRGHTLFTLDDEMKDMKIVFGGDQLTRVRFVGAKDLVADSHKPIDRLEHCGPHKPVMFHTRASLTQYAHHLLFKADSVNQIGTLKYFREKFNRKNSTPTKVLDSYEGTEELFLSMGRSYIIAAALKFFGMKGVEDTPSINTFPKNVIHKSMMEKKSVP